MPSQYDIYSAASKKASGGEEEAQRAQKLKSQWNDFIDFLDKRGVKGHPELDKGLGNNNVGIGYVKEFQKENPGTLITPENITEVQTHFKNYRDYTIDQLRTGKAQLTDAQNPKGRPVAPNENLDYYMKDLSRIDGIPGSKTTGYKFPTDFMTTIYKAPSGAIEKKETVYKGLATIN